jgi:hypothetical protein
MDSSTKPQVRQGLTQLIVIETRRHNNYLDPLELPQAHSELVRLLRESSDVKIKPHFNLETLSAYLILGIDKMITRQSPSDQQLGFDLAWDIDKIIEGGDTLCSGGRHSRYMVVVTLEDDLAMHVHWVASRICNKTNAMPN